MYARAEAGARLQPSGIAHPRADAVEEDDFGVDLERTLRLEAAGYEVEAYDFVGATITPHNLLLTEETLSRLGAVAKVVPPLRPEADTLAMRQALAAGFDAHRLDPLAQMELDDEDFGWITREVMAIAADTCAGRIVSVLEGGYDLDARYAGIKGRILDEAGSLRRFVNVYVGNDDVRFLEGLGTETPSGVQVSVIPAVAGGC